MTSPAKMDDAALQKLEAELDPEMQFRPLLPWTAWIVAGLLLALSCFHYYTAGFGLLAETTHRGVHMAFVLGLIFLVFPARKARDGQGGGSLLLGPLALVVGAVALYLPFLAATAKLPVNVLALAVILGIGALIAAGYATSWARTETPSALAPLGIGLSDWALVAAAVVTSLYVPDRKSVV